MDDFDHADLDGDGEFDAIDMEILEDGGKDGRTPSSGSGCMVVFAVGASLIVVTYRLAEIVLT